MLENTIGLLITEIVEANPNELDVDVVFQHDGAPHITPDNLETI